MTSKTSSIMLSIMSSIDDIKDKINDGEYLNLCNLLKSLNDNIKHTPDDDIDNNDDADNSGTDTEMNMSIVERLNNYQYNPAFYDDNGHLIIDSVDFYNGFNELLAQIEIEYENREHEWFICGCCASVRTSDITDHIINSETHAVNFGRR